jgi:transmembrane sensor
MDIDLLIHYISGETSAEENKTVEIWCAQDINNQEQLDDLRKVWEMSGLDQDPAVAETAESLIRFKQKEAAQKTSNSISTQKTYPLKYWMQIAAVFAGLPLMIWFYLIQTKSSGDLIVSTTIKTETTQLSDGSTVVLNKNSSLKYPEVFIGGTRTVNLQKGEAFFTVSHDTRKPFYVLVKGIHIKVVGTAFNVKVKGKQTEIIVESGKVQVSKNRIRVLLMPQESVTINTTGTRLLKEKHTDLLYNYYRSKEFIANGTPLYKLAEVLEEAYDVHIAFESERVKQLPMSTTFKDESLDDILTVISKTFRLKVNRNGNQISFSNAQ